MVFLWFYTLRTVFNESLTISVVESSFFSISTVYSLMVNWHREVNVAYIIPIEKYLPEQAIPKYVLLVVKQTVVNK